MNMTGKCRYIDPVGYRCSILCVSRPGDHDIKKIAAEFLDDLVSRIKSPFAFATGCYPQAGVEPRRMMTNELIDPGVQPLSADTLLLKSRGNRYSGDFFHEDIGFSYIYVESDSIRPYCCEETAEYREDVLRMQQILALSGNKIPDEQKTEYLQRILLCEDETLASIRVPHRMLKSQLSSYGLFHFMGKPVEVHARPWVGESQEHANAELYHRWSQEGVWIYTIGICLPRFLFPEGTMPAGMQKQWTQRLRTLSRKCEYATGVVHMDSILPRSEFFTARMLVPLAIRDITEKIPAYAWGLLLSKAQAELLGGQARLEGEGFVVDPMENGGIYVRLTSDINRYPVRDLIRMKNVMRPCLSPNSEYHTSIRNLCLQSFRYPLEGREIEMKDGMVTICEA